MIKQPLNEYIEKLVAYNRNNFDASTYYHSIESFTNNAQLTKGTTYVNKNSFLQCELLKRYMDIKRWIRK